MVEFSPNMCEVRTSVLSTMRRAGGGVRGRRRDTKKNHESNIVSAVLSNFFKPTLRKNEYYTGFRF